MNSAPSSGQAAASALKREHWLGLSIVAVAFAAAVAVSKDSDRRSQPWFSEEPAPPSAEGLVGFPNQVSVLSSYERAAALTPRKHLASVHAFGVGADGTVNLEKPNTRIRFLFQSDPGEGPVPRRPSGTLARRPYCGQQAVDITASGIGARQDNAAVGCEPEPRYLEPPSCGPKQLWELAKSKGAEENALADIEYIAGQDGPVWRFKLSASNLEFATRQDCKTELP